MAPAGLMWSVVMESPNRASIRAPSMSFGAFSGFSMPSKKGGFFTYVDSSSHWYVLSLLNGMPCQTSSPLKTSAYSLRNMASSTLDTSWAISALEGQMSFR